MPVNVQNLNVPEAPDPKGDLEKLLKDGGDKLYDVDYGDIIEDDEGKKIYASVEIRPATSDTIIKSVFKMDPTATYETEDGKLLADKDTTVEDAVTTLTDNHMEMLYGNHDYGGGVSGDTGSGEVGSPLPPGKPINVVSPLAIVSIRLIMYGRVMKGRILSAQAELRFMLQIMERLKLLAGITDMVIAYV